MGNKQFYRQQWSRYLGELRPIHDIYINAFPSTPTGTPPSSPTPTPTVSPTTTPSVTPTNTISPTPSITPNYCCDTLIFSGKSSSYSAYTGTYTKQPMGGGYYGYMDDSPAFTIKCQSYIGLYWSVWLSANNDVIIFSEQSNTWRVVDNESSIVNCQTYLPTFTYQNITNSYIVDCNGLQIPVPIDNANYSISYSGCGSPPLPTSTPTATIGLTPSTTPSVTPSNSPTSTPGISPTSTPTFTPTPSVTPSITTSVTPTNSPTPSPEVTQTSTLTPSVTPTSTVTPSITPTNTNTPTITSTPTPTSGVTGCLCYTILNETGSPINYQWDDCVLGASMGSLGGGANVQVCSVDLPIVDPGGTITPCSSVTNCSESSDCTGCS